MSSQHQDTQPSTHTSRKDQRSISIEQHYTEQSNTTPRSKDSHPCITICRSGSAFGLPEGLHTVAEARATRFMIVSGWSSC
ncbi:hypothetical protein AFB00_08825 [Pseudonocardia sp. HH130630-07]|nr:hypothetical protein AFB00_08825 [Pseudonocardia sp. HH130630-07]